VPLLDKKTVQIFHSWFGNYVKSFYSGDENIDFHIRLKEEHTIRVCKNIYAIGKAIGLDEEKLAFAETIGLFHDVGRFEQFKKYRTFSDNISEDHAKLGVKVLNEQQVLHCLPDSEREVILKAIGYHNVCWLPDIEEPSCQLFSKMIRDADKLDIYSILVKYYQKPEIYPYLKVGESSKTTGYSKSIIEDILKNRNIMYTDAKTSDEMKLLRLSWVFDINYDFTLREIDNRGFVKAIIKALPSNEDIEKVGRHIEKYIRSRLDIK
jgi:putative nucleotidyltransferase with HDIG domain